MTPWSILKSRMKTTSLQYDPLPKTLLGKEHGLGSTKACRARKVVSQQRKERGGKRRDRRGHDAVLHNLVSPTRPLSLREPHHDHHCTLLVAFTMNWWCLLLPHLIPLPTTSRVVLTKPFAPTDRHHTHFSRCPVLHHRHHHYYYYIAGFVLSMRHPAIFVFPISTPPLYSVVIPSCHSNRQFFLHHESS